MNEQIRKSPIRVIDENNEQLGVMETSAALHRAREAGLDLVEIHADSEPPVCRILDYGKFRYEQSKKEKANKARSKTAELKEVRLGRSMKIDPHDVEIRLNQARRFLMEGHKVQIVQNFRGREMMHKDKGSERLDGIITALEDISKVEVPARLAGRRMTLILAPDKTKIEKIKRKLAAEKARQSGKPEDPATAPAPENEPVIDSVHEPETEGAATES
jgi:translation initiation factor IF-3